MLSRFPRSLIALARAARPVAIPFRYGAPFNATKAVSPPEPPSVQPTLGFHTSALAMSQRASQLSGLRRKLRKAGKDWFTTSISVPLLTDALRTLQSRQAIKGKNDRSAPYRDALRDLSQITVGKENLLLQEIEEVLTEENGIAWRTISELVIDGQVKLIKEMSEETQAACLFNRVHGIGGVKAVAFAESGIRTLEELEKMPNLTKAMKLGLHYMEDLETMIPREEISAFHHQLNAAFLKADPTIGFEIMGSYRRGEKMSSDIDLVAWHDSHQNRHDESQSKACMEKIKAALTEAGLIRDDMLFQNGDKKIMGLTRLPGNADGLWRQIDIRICPVPSMPYMLLGNTGDDTLMKILRQAAKDKGWVLNEYGMGTPRDHEASTWVKEGHEIIVEDEEEIFSKIGVPYLAPEQRSYKVYERILPKRFLSF